MLAAGCVGSEARLIGQGGAAGEGGGAAGATGGGSTTSTGAGGGAGGQTGPCGDGMLDMATEQCDDGNRAPQDGCDTICEVECPVGWLEPMTHHCYVLIATATTWQDARTGCMALAPGYDLAAVSSQAEHDFLLTKLPAAMSTMWIGANDLSVEGTFEWANGEPWGFVVWEAMEPNDALMAEDCVTLRNVLMGGYMWNDLSCIETPPSFLCELTPAGTNP
jgi:cysteine-rich repeat protein